MGNTVYTLKQESAQGIRTDGLWTFSHFRKSCFYVCHNYIEFIQHYSIQLTTQVIHIKYLAHSQTMG